MALTTSVAMPATGCAERETIRCAACNLNQFKTRSGNCRRCSVPYVVDRIPPPAVPAPRRRNDFQPAQMPGRIRQLRMLRHLTQDEMSGLPGKRSGTWVSRVECGMRAPSLGWLEKIATIAGISLPALFEDSLVFAALADPFIGELLPLVPQLTAEQRTRVLTLLAGLEEKAAAA